MPVLVAGIALLLLAGAASCASPMLVAAAMANLATAQTEPSALARSEIPGLLLPHYQRAPACEGLPWQLIAAIGWVETRHATSDGAHVDPPTGDVQPRIVGIALDGARSAAIRVPPGGSPWHGDQAWDHAVGPMQFITGTWARWGLDASGDGLASPHNAYDAIAAAGRHLCNGRPRLDSPEAAIRRYNPSDRYIDDVLAKAHTYGMVDGGDPVAGLRPPGDLTAVGPMVRGDARVVVSYALAQLGKPYVYAADGPDSFDCSGLVLAAYAQIGVRLPHRADIQVRYGRPVDWRREPIKPGDLIFLRGGRPVHDYGHVGVAIDAKLWIHAPRTGDVVKIAALPTRIQSVRRIVVR